MKGRDASPRGSFCYRRHMKWEQLCKLGRELPEVVEDFWYGTRALKVRKKGFVRLKEDATSVVFMLESIEEQESLITGQPEVFYITDHYRGYASVLARLAKLQVSEARLRLERAWLVKAPPALVEAFYGGPTDAPPRRRKK
jgi:hypothetical protein